MASSFAPGTTTITTVVSVLAMLLVGSCMPSSGDPTTTQPTDPMLEVRLDWESEAGSYLVSSYEGCWNGTCWDSFDSATPRSVRSSATVTLRSSTPTTLSACVIDGGACHDLALESAGELEWVLQLPDESPSTIYLEARADDGSDDYALYLVAVDTTSDS